MEINNKTYLLWYYILSKGTKNSQTWNAYIKKLEENNLTDILKISLKDMEKEIYDFINGKYEVVKKETK